MAHHNVLIGRKDDSKCYGLPKLGIRNEGISLGHIDNSDKCKMKERVRVFSGLEIRA